MSYAYTERFKRGNYSDQATVTNTSSSLVSLLAGINNLDGKNITISSNDTGKKLYINFNGDATTNHGFVEAPFSFNLQGTNELSVITDTTMIISVFGFVN